MQPLAETPPEERVVIQYPTRAGSFNRLSSARRWMLMTVPRMLSILKDARRVS